MWADHQCNIFLIWFLTHLSDLLGFNLHMFLTNIRVCEQNSITNNNSIMNLSKINSWKCNKDIFLLKYREIETIIKISLVFDLFLLNGIEIKSSHFLMFAMCIIFWMIDYLDLSNLSIERIHNLKGFLPISKLLIF